MQRINISLSIVSLLLIFMSISRAYADDVIERTAKGEVNWTTGIVKAIGYGVAPADVANVKKRMMARRAAQLDAYRNLAELINGVRVSSETVVKDLTTSSDVVKTSLQATIKGAVITNEEYNDEYSIVEMSLSMDGKLLQVVTPPNAFKNDSFTLHLPEYSKALINVLYAFSTGPSWSPRNAFAAENSVPNNDLVITDTSTLELVKQLTSMLKQAPAEQVIQTLEQQISAYENTAQFTGILIDARQVTNFEYATVPRIRDTAGNIIYPSIDALTSGSFSKRPVSYDFDVTDAVRNKRVAIKPYIVKATSTYKARKSDLIIDDQAAQLLRTHQQLLTALGKAGVMIVMAK